MKHLIMVLSVVLACTFQQSLAETIISNVTVPTKLVGAEADSIYAEQLVSRLEEIKSMDKSTMTVTEKRQLRKEVRSIKAELRAISGGVYLSATAVIIILVILILIL